MSKVHMLENSYLEPPALDSSGQPPYGGDMDQRVTRLEVIAETLADGIRDLREEMRGFREEMRSDMNSLRNEVRSDAKSVRLNIWLAAITVITFGGGAMYGIVQTTLAAIDTGREAAKVQAQAPAQPMAQQPPIIINVPVPALPPPDKTR